MSRTRLPGAIAALIVPMLLLTSCGGESGPKPIVIWMQMDPQERERFVANLDEYQEAHPDILVEHLPFDTEQLRTQFQTAAAAGGGPDLVFGPSDQIGPLSILKLIRPLEDIMPAGYFESFLPASLDTLDGHLYAAPDQIGNHLVLCYNADLVDKTPETFDEFLAVAKKNTSGSGTESSYGFVMNQTEPYWLVPFLGGFGGWVMDKDANPTLDSPAMVKALQLLYDLKSKHKVMPRESDYQVSETLFKENRAAMIINGPWAWAGYREAGVDLRVAPIFEMPGGGPGMPMVASKGYSVNVNIPDERLPQVLDLLQFLTSPEAELRMARELGILPSRKEAYEDGSLLEDPIMAASWEAMNKCRRMPVVPEMRVIWDVMRPGMQDVMNGVKDPKDAAADMQKLAIQRIAETKL
jgi:maltose-binding protein MalE